MHITRDIGHHGAVALGLAGLFGAAVLGAQLAASAIISIGELLIH